MTFKIMKFRLEKSVLGTDLVVYLPPLRGYPRNTVFDLNKTFIIGFMVEKLFKFNI